ncbi:MAG: tRNA threonylcarbamoyladenosine dehydratase [Muribaculaceae bacterium]|nr:tRNA threonylcarbamoyladenosine dehydratase [Muribaculaceae bacterium]
MEELWNSRTLTLLGEEGCGKLAAARVCVVGVGGVGGYAAEMLARSGVGHLTLIDADNVSVSNINRQLIATHSTIGQPKTELLARRFRDINPGITVDARSEFLTPESVATLLDEDYDYVIDAIDTVAPKVALLAECLRRRVPIVSSMGAGGRLDPAKVELTDLWSTSEDGLARAVRQRLKKMGLRRTLKVVASREAPRRYSLIPLDEQNKRSSFGTLATIPSLFGIYLASHVITSLTGNGR